MRPNVDYIEKQEVVTPEFMLNVIEQYYDRKWNTNKDTVAAVKSWKNWPMVVRMPDINKDYTVMIHEGVVIGCSIGLPKEPRILTTMLAETMQRIYYDESTAAIELIGGRIKVRGNETERRRMLAAISYLTW